MDIVDSGSVDERNYIDTQVYPNIPPGLSSHKFAVHFLDMATMNMKSPQFAIYQTSEKLSLRRSRNANAIECLKIGLATGAEWILFVEDDVDVCGDFLGSVDRWLAGHARRNRHLYSFCTPYKQIRTVRARGGTAWEFPWKAFYGNQCLVFHKRDAALAAKFIEDRMNTWDTGQGFDLLLKHWAAATWPGIPSLLSSVPSFAQHIGEESSLHFGRFHTGAEFGGPDYVYQAQEVRVSE
jgi:hypothetical protein